MNGSIGHRGAEYSLDEQLGSILEGNHHEQVMRSHHPQEGDEHEGEAIEPISYGRASDGAYPKFLALGLFLDFLHEPCIRECTEEEAH